MEGYSDAGQNRHTRCWAVQIEANQPGMCGVYEPDVVSSLVSELLCGVYGFWEVVIEVLIDDVDGIANRPDVAVKSNVQVIHRYNVHILDVRRVHLCSTRH